MIPLIFFPGQWNEREVLTNPELFQVNRYLIPEDKDDGNINDQHLRKVYKDEMMIPKGKVGKDTYTYI